MNSFGRSLQKYEAKPYGKVWYESYHMVWYHGMVYGRLHTPYRRRRILCAPNHFLEEDISTGWYHTIPYHTIPYTKSESFDM
jgi:hypothetical protein